MMIKVVDAAVAKAYGGAKRIQWMEVYAGEKSTRIYGPDVWLPEETLAAVREYVVSIKGPLTTPVGGGIRSLNVALRQELDLYVCLRPVRYFAGVPSPVKQPEKIDMVIFRENSEDIYAGIEFEAGSDKVFDTTVAIVTGDEVRRERAAARGHALVDEREARQLTQPEKAERAEHVIENDGSVEDLERGLSALLEKLRP